MNQGFFNLGLSKTLPESLEDLGVWHVGVAWVCVARRFSLPGMKPMMDPRAQGLVAWRAASLEVLRCWKKPEKRGDALVNDRFVGSYKVVLTGFLLIHSYYCFFLFVWYWLVDRQAIYEFFVQLHKKGNFLLVPTSPHHSTLEPDRSREAALRAIARFSGPML